MGREDRRVRSVLDMEVEGYFESQRLWVLAAGFSFGNGKWSLAKRHWHWHGALGGVTFCHSGQYGIA